MNGGLADRRIGGWRGPYAALIATTALLSANPAIRLSAQVGHEPASSPYRDILLHSGPMLFVGHLGGGRGSVDAGTSNALTLGARYELPAGHALQFQFTTALLRGDRYIIDPAADSNAATRRTGPVKSELALAEIGMQLRLTGGKTWRGFAPYIGTALGMLFDVSSPGDTTKSGYSFGTKFSLALASGVRWYPARRVTVNADLRANFWRLKYPISFHAQAPDFSRVVPLTKPLAEWTAHPWISLGIGWTF
jgi:hypothetical protein